MIEHLQCMYCYRPAFAVLNIELSAGRGRWPVCRGYDCINRALFDGGIRLANAAGIRLAGGAPAVEVPRCEYVSASPWGPTQCVLRRGHGEQERHAFSPSETVEANVIEVASPPCSTCGDVASDHGWPGDEHQQCTQCDCREYTADEWTNPVTGHGADCGCISCHMSQTQ